MQHQIGGFDAPFLFKRKQQRVQSARGKEGSFDIPGWDAGEHHLFNAVQEPREVHAGPAFLGPKKG